MEIKSKLSKFYRWQYFWLCVIVLATLIMHFSIITYPSDIILDEAHYVNDARNIIADNGTMRPEHPPLAKLIIVAGIEVFGDNPWGWRVFPILFGTAAIVLFYFLCRRLNMSPTASNIATFLLATENMTFVMNHVAMLDVFYVAFMMGAFLLYACRKYITSGIAIGLSGLAKLYGALALPAVIIHWFFTRQGRSRWFALTVLFAALSFVELMILFDFAISHHLVDPINRIKEMLSLSGSLTFANVTHPAASHPWEWVINYKTMAFYIMPHYTAAISFTIWAMIIPTFGYMIYRAVKGNDAALFGVAWFASTFLIWIPATLITDRVSYPYYFYPTIGAICLGLGMALSQLLDFYRSRRSGKLKMTALIAFIAFLALHLISFLILSPFIPVDFAKLVGITG
jgi:predicted membrane-bound dolichyl-phosphate-mannose-protein mannosyltransferase